MVYQETLVLLNFKTHEEHLITSIHILEKTSKLPCRILHYCIVCINPEHFQNKDWRINIPAKFFKNSGELYVYVSTWIYIRIY